MDKLSPNEFFRYVLSAGVGVLALFLSYPRALEGSVGGLTAVEAGVLGVGLMVAGSAVYSLHRSLLHPLIQRAILWVLFRARPQMDHRGRFNPLVPTAFERKFIAKRWGKPDGATRAERWASQVHALYCSAWTVGAIILWAPTYLGRPEHPAALAWMLATMLGGAVVDDIRLCYTVTKIEIEEQP